MFLRRVARPLMMMAKVKETTGMVGLDVVPNPREVVIGLYTKTLNEIKAVPRGVVCREAVETFASYSLKVCQEEVDLKVIMKRLGCRKVEELIEGAQDELDFVCQVIEEREVILNDAPVPKHIPLHRPGPVPEEFYKTMEPSDTGTLEYAISASEKVDPAITSTEPQAK